MRRWFHKTISFTPGNYNREYCLRSFGIFFPNNAWKCSLTTVLLISFEQKRCALKSIANRSLADYIVGSFSGLSHAAGTRIFFILHLCNTTGEEMGENLSMMHLILAVLRWSRKEIIPDIGMARYFLGWRKKRTTNDIEKERQSIWVTLRKTKDMQVLYMMSKHICDQWGTHNRVF